MNRRNFITSIGGIIVGGSMFPIQASSYDNRSNVKIIKIDVHHRDKKVKEHFREYIKLPYPEKPISNHDVDSTIKAVFSQHNMAYIYIFTTPHNKTAICGLGGPITNIQDMRYDDHGIIIPLKQHVKNVNYTLN